MQGARFTLRRKTKMTNPFYVIKIGNYYYEWNRNRDNPVQKLTSDILEASRFQVPEIAFQRAKEMNGKVIQVVIEENEL